MAKEPIKGFGSGPLPAFFNNPGKRSKNQYTGAKSRIEEPVAPPQKLPEPPEEPKTLAKAAEAPKPVPASQQPTLAQKQAAVRNPTRAEKEKGFEKDKAPDFFKNERKETLLQKLDRQIRARNIQRFSQQSFKWYTDKLLTLGQKPAQDELLGMKDHVRRDIRPGFMYTYRYDAKHKDTLKYWDKFPLIIMIGPAKGGWYGINLHYLPPRTRAAFFDKLLAISSDVRFDNNTKIKVTYGFLKSTSQYKEFKPCFKHYLKSHVKSKFIKIQPDEWEAVLYFPTTSFESKGSKYASSRVWSDSMLQIKGL
jgi:hypothetical protein